jgi:hypothetical protein
MIIIANNTATNPITFVAFVVFILIINIIRNSLNFMQLITMKVITTITSSYSRLAANLDKNIFEILKLLGGQDLLPHTLFLIS